MVIYCHCVAKWCFAMILVIASCWWSLRLWGFFVFIFYMIWIPHLQLHIWKLCFSCEGWRPWRTARKSLKTFGLDQNEKYHDIIVTSSSLIVWHCLSSCVARASRGHIYLSCSPIVMLIADFNIKDYFSIYHSRAKKTNQMFKVTHFTISWKVFACFEINCTNAS